MLNQDFPGLTLIGVGPGDPSLLTLAAVEAIEKADVVAYPASEDGEAGMAAKIANKWISRDKKKLPIYFPMTTEIIPREIAWRKASDALAAEVALGQRVVFLSQGDVSLYSTSSYVLMGLRLNHPECSVSLIPGISSISAAAASAGWPIALQQEKLLILPTPNEPEELETLLESDALTNKVLALLKLGKRWEWVKPLLKRKGLLTKALFAQRLGLPGEKVSIASEIGTEERPYFSLLLVRKGWPEVMP